MLLYDLVTSHMFTNTIIGQPTSIYTCIQKENNSKQFKCISKMEIFLKNILLWFCFLLQIGLPFVAGAYLGSELFQNTGLEEDLSDSNWFCVGCKLDKSNDSFTGGYSGQVTERLVLST